VTAQRIVVIGAGIVGLAIARRLAQVEPDAELTVLEKEAGLARHQTGHNSGVVHAGVYYAPGSLKAALCRRGMTLLKEYCAERGIAYRECGKLIVARDPGELRRLDELERRAIANQVPGLRRLRPLEMAAVEPHIRGVAALHSPHTAIVDFQAVAGALAADLFQAGAEIRLRFEVTGIERRGEEVRVRSSAGDELAADRLVVCGGLQSDRLARLGGDDPAPWIVPFRGEYYRLVPARRDLVHGLIYPVPDPDYPFLGVHFTRRVDGNVDIGPNAVLALAREGYRRADFVPRDVWEMLVSKGFRRLVREHWRTGVRELHASLSRHAFLTQAQAFVPSLQIADVMRAPAGVRAQAVAADGSLLDDFHITYRGRLVFVRNAPSPAATSSLAIAEYVVDRLGERRVRRIGAAPQ
jgi:L-2-hydroxyglutarate oxidase LhgO